MACPSSFALRLGRSSDRDKSSRHDGDIDGFVAGSKELHSLSAMIIHNVVPADITINATKAVADSWCLIQSRHLGEEHEYEMKTPARLLYRVELVEGQWKLLSLRPIYMYDLITAVPPAPPPSFGDLSHFRRSYRFTAFMVQCRGRTISHDLPGMDDAKSVAEVEERHHKWLYGN